MSSSEDLAKEKIEKWKSLGKAVYRNAMPFFYRSFKKGKEEKRNTAISSSFASIHLRTQLHASGSYNYCYSYFFSTINYLLSRCLWLKIVEPSAFAIRFAEPENQYRRPRQIRWCRENLYKVGGFLVRFQFFFLFEERHFWKSQTKIFTCSKQTGGLIRFLLQRQALYKNIGSKAAGFPTIV